MAYNFVIRHTKSMHCQTYNIKEFLCSWNTSRLSISHVAVDTWPLYSYSGASQDEKLWLRSWVSRRSKFLLLEDFSFFAPFLRFYDRSSDPYEPEPPLFTSLHMLIYLETLSWHQAWVWVCLSFLALFVFHLGEVFLCKSFSLLSRLSRVQAKS